MSTGEGSEGGASTRPTAKVIGLGGDLKEYGSAVKAGEVLALESTASFLCSSDKLFCNEFIPAVDADVELQLGQIYFILPVEKLREVLTQEKMTALAVKAISAMAAAAEKDGRRRTIRFTAAAPLECKWGVEEVNGFGPKETKRAPPFPAVQRKMKRSGSMKKTKWSAYHRHRADAANLGSIPEFVSE